MGAVETLVHTYDIVGGPGGTWIPPTELCRPIVERLFPDAPAGRPPDVLLWCTGRRPLGAHPRRQDGCWDGRVRD